MKRQAVITGLGCVSSLGNAPGEFCRKIKRNLKQGVFPANPPPNLFKGRIENFQFTDRELLQKYPGLDISCQYILQAAAAAIGQAGITPEIINRYRVGVIIGSTFGLLDSQEKFLKTLYRTGKGSPLFFQQTANNLLSGVIAYKYHMDGLNMTLYNGWTAGLDSVILAGQLILTRQVDLALAGGVDILNETIAENYQYRIRQHGFTKRFFPAEGAGVLVMEGSEIAVGRGQKIIGWLSGDRQSFFGDLHEYTTVLGNIIDDYRCPLYFANANGTKLDDYEAELIATKNMDVMAMKLLTGECGAASGLLEIIYALYDGKKSLIVNAALGGITAVVIEEFKKEGCGET